MVDVVEIPFCAWVRIKASGVQSSYTASAVKRACRAGAASSWAKFEVRTSASFSVVRRAKQGASYEVKDLLFQNLASRNYRVLQLYQLTH
jgi:hypothetical protein